MPQADNDTIALRVPGLFRHLWETKIRDFEFDPRLTAVGMSEDTAEELEVRRNRVVASETERLRELGIGTPRERYEAGETFQFSRSRIGGNLFGADYVREHPLVRDRSIRWLRVDADDVVTLGESPTLRR